MRRSHASSCGVFNHAVIPSMADSTARKARTAATMISSPGRPELRVGGMPSPPGGVTIVPATAPAQTRKHADAHHFHRVTRIPRQRACA